MWRYKIIGIIVLVLIILAIFVSLGVRQEPEESLNQIYFDRPSEFTFQPLNDQTIAIGLHPGITNLVGFQGRINFYKTTTEYPGPGPTFDQELKLIGQTKTGENILFLHNIDMGGMMWEYIIYLPTTNPKRVSVLEITMGTDEQLGDQEEFRLSQASRDQQRAELLRIFETMVRSVRNVR